MARKRKTRSIIALSIIVLVGLLGATFIGIKLWNRAPREARALRNADNLIRAGRYEEACVEAGLSLGYPEYDFDARGIIAGARVKLKQFEAAQEVIQSGLTDERRKQYDEAMTILKEELNKLDTGQDRAIRQTELEKGFRTTHRGYAEYLDLQLLGVKVMLSHMQSLISSHPEELTLTVEAEERSGVRRQVEDMMNQTLRTLQKLLADHPENARIYTMLGDTYQTRTTFVRTAGSSYVREARHFRLMDNDVAAATTRRRGRQTIAEIPLLRVRAIWAFRNASHCAPDSPANRIRLANLLRSGPHPDYEQALAELNEVLKQTETIPQPFVTTAKVICADLKRRTGKSDEAISDMKTLVEQMPEDSSVALMYADLLLERAESTNDAQEKLDCLKEAREWIERTEKHTRNPQLVFQKSRVLLAQNEPTEAAANLQQVLDQLPPLEYGLPFVARGYYYLGKARLFYVEQARLALERAEQAVRETRKTGIREKVEKAIQDKQAAEQKYHRLAREKSKTGLDDLNEAIIRIRMVRTFLPPDEVKRMDRVLVDAQTTIVNTMLARGDLGNAPERMLNTLAVDLDNDMVYQLLSKAIEQEKDIDKSRRLTVAAVNFRLLSGRNQAALKESEAAIAVFGITETEARKALKAAERSSSETGKVLDRIRAAEQLQAVAGLARLLEGTRESGLDHFRQASLLRSIRNPNNVPTPDVYAQQQYALIIMLRARRGMQNEANRTMQHALKQFPKGESLLITKAGLAREQGHLGTAIKTYKKVITVNPRRGALYTVLARLYLDMGMSDEAGTLLGQIPANAERSYRLLVGLADIYSRLGDHDNLRKILAEILTRYEDHAQIGLRVKLVAASFYMDCGDYTKASQLAGAIPATMQAPPELHVQRANIFIATGEFDKAAKALEAVMTVRPDDPSFYTLGLVYLQMDQGRVGATEPSQRRVVQALELARKVGETCPEFPHARLLEAAALFHNDQLARAFELLETSFPAGSEATINSELGRQLQSLILIAQNQLTSALKNIPPPEAGSGKVGVQLSEAEVNMLKKLAALPQERKLSALKTLARSHLARRTGLWRLARPNDEELAKVLADDPITTIHLAITCGQTRDMKRACSVLTDYLRVDPDFAQGWRLLGQLHSQADNLKEAETAFRKFLVLVNDALVVEVQLAEVLERDGRGDDAVPIYESVISRSDRFPNVLNNLAYRLLIGDTPDVDRALDYAKRAVQLSPFNGNYRDTLGWTHYVRNEDDDAVTQLERAVSLNPSSSVIRYHLGMAYLKQTSAPLQERRLKAAKALREALAISPNFPEAGLAAGELKKLTTP